VKDFFQDKVLLNYLPGLALNCNPPDLCSWVARITGASHQCPDIIEIWESFIYVGYKAFLGISFKMLFSCLWFIFWFFLFETGSPYITQLVMLLSHLLYIPSHLGFKIFS
jgi:hypothetical protein